MANIGTFTEPKNKNGNHDLLNLKFRKNDSLALIIEIL